MVSARHSVFSLVVLLHCLWLGVGFYVSGESEEVSAAKAINEVWSQIYNSPTSAACHEGGNGTCPDCISRKCSFVRAAGTTSQDTSRISGGICVDGGADKTRFGNKLELTQACKSTDSGQLLEIQDPGLYLQDFAKENKTLLNEVAEVFPANRLSQSCRARSGLGCETCLRNSHGQCMFLSLTEPLHNSSVSVENCVGAANSSSSSSLPTLPNFTPMQICEKGGKAKFPIEELLSQMEAVEKSKRFAHFPDIVALKILNILKNFEASSGSNCTAKISCQDCLQEPSCTSIKVKSTAFHGFSCSSVSAIQSGSILEKITQNSSCPDGVQKLHLVKLDSLHANVAQSILARNERVELLATTLQFLPDGNSTCHAQQDCSGCTAAGCFFVSSIFTADDVPATFESLCVPAFNASTPLSGLSITKDNCPAKTEKVHPRTPPDGTMDLATSGAPLILVFIAFFGVVGANSLCHRRRTQQELP